MSDRVKRAWGLAAALALVVFIIDQVVKNIVEHHIVLREQVDVLGPLKLTLSHNEGVAFGLADGGGALLVAITLIALGVVLWLFARDPARPWMWVATGLLAGGAVGNLVDRLRHGHVTDFIELPHWPPFNLADCGITCGVVILLVIYVREAERAERDS
ncbi:MAG: signal peptidase II [Actinobacteria bacterium]|nr:signal peptidase II [Actinomycetota bacterium]OJU83428.1 MAG: signal peptidase II [Solirubrobacterales bacterium 70-9]